MHFPQVKIGLVAGFGVSLILMIALLWIGLANMASIQQHLDTVVQQNNVKTELARRMREISRERTVCLYRMIASPDPFLRDEEFMRFHALAGDFVAARTAFLELQPDQMETTVLDEQGKLSGVSIVLQNRVIELVADEQFEEAGELLYTKTVPAQDSVFRKLGELLNIQKDKVLEAEVEADHSYRKTVMLTVVLGFIAVMLAISVAVFVVRRTLGIERALITNQQQLEMRVAQRTRDLSDYATELEDLTYSIAHDLRGPLRGIDGFSLFLLEEFDDKLSSTGRDYLSRIRAANRKMSDIIDALLRITRVIQRKLSLEPVDLGEVARDIGQDLELREPQRNVEFSIQDGMQCQADRALIKMALEQLLANAWKFTRNQDPAGIEMFSKQSGDGGTVFCIKDNGVGFDMQYVGKIFKPFECLHNPDEFEGIGIGLAIVARIIQRHGGRVWAEGSSSGGAKVFFTLETQMMPAIDTGSPLSGHGSGKEF